MDTRNKSEITDLPLDGDSECGDNVPDPRVQRELDKLNVASTDINRLENELDEARSIYRSTVSLMSTQMEVLAKSNKNCIRKAREFYRISAEAKLAQSEALKAARQYQTAVGVYQAAKETVALAEKRLIENTSSAAAPLSAAWQEMLNHAISKVSEAEKEKAKGEDDHRRRSLKYAELKTRLEVLEKKFSRSIKKAKPYFDLKAELDTKLMQQKQNVTDLHAAIKCTKLKYNESLRRLESISEEIHEARKAQYWRNIPRMPGVGADTDSVASGLSEVDLTVFEGSINSSDYDETTDDANETGDKDEGLLEIKDSLDKLNVHSDHLESRSTENKKVASGKHGCDEVTAKAVKLEDIVEEKSETEVEDIVEEKSETEVEDIVEEKSETEVEASNVKSEMNNIKSGLEIQEIAETSTTETKVSVDFPLQETQSRTHKLNDSEFRMKSGVVNSSMDGKKTIDSEMVEIEQQNKCLFRLKHIGSSPYIIENTISCYENI